MHGQSQLSIFTDGGRAGAAHAPVMARSDAGSPGFPVRTSGISIEEGQSWPRVQRDSLAMKQS